MTIYHIKAKNLAGEVVASFYGGGRGAAGGGLQNFTYTKWLGREGGHVLSIFGDDERKPYIVRDGIFEFYRNDPLWIGKGFYKDFESFHLARQTVFNDDGSRILISKGFGFNVLLWSEPILYDAGTSYTCKSGPAETVAKEYVNENIGPGAGLDYAGGNRVRQGLTVEPDTGKGANWEGCRSYLQLGDVINELANAGPGDYMIVGTGGDMGPNTFEFQWRDVRWGSDKRRGTANPVVFSDESGTATNIDVVEDWRTEVNVCSALGWGLGEARIEEVASIASATATPWSRRAVARDARDLGNRAHLIERANETIEKQRTKPFIRLETIQSSQLRYGRDYNLGDLVTVESEGATYDRKIVAVTVSVESTGQETVMLELEEE